MIDLRKPTEEDLARFRFCLENDPDHKGQDPHAWESEPGELLTFCDKKGNRVWVRIERTLRVHVQHDPEVPNKEQIALFYRAFAWLQGAARESKFAEVVFESKAQPLIRFFQKRFGFAQNEHDYSVKLV